ncbi:MAG: DUF4810 domain-containing protein [Bacteroidota bacterium]|nr:DUF4810 domain-containing protein [Bacteroidota bacterium]
MKIISSVIVAIIVLQFIGCAPETQFYWGNYSKTLYAYKKSPDDKTLAVHKNSLNDIITVSTKKHATVPPGVYAELGYILLKENKEKESFECFDKEIKLYPESIEFIGKLKAEFHSGETK